MRTRAEARRQESLLRRVVREELHELVVTVLDAMRQAFPLPEPPAVPVPVPVPVPVEITEPVAPSGRPKGRKRAEERRSGMPTAAKTPLLPRNAEPVAEPEAAPPVIAEPPTAEPAQPAACAVVEAPVHASLPPVPAMVPVALTPRPPVREVEHTTPKIVRAWLEQRYRDGGLGKIAAEDKVAAMTHDEALRQANIRRAALKQPLFAFLGGKT